MADGSARGTTPNGPDRGYSWGVGSGPGVGMKYGHSYYPSLVDRAPGDPTGVPRMYGSRVEGPTHMHSMEPVRSPLQEFAASSFLHRIPPTQRVQLYPRPEFEGQLESRYNPHGYPSSPWHGAEGQMPHALTDDMRHHMSHAVKSGGVPQAQRSYLMPPQPLYMAEPIHRTDSAVLGGSGPAMSISAHSLQPEQFCMAPMTTPKPVVVHDIRSGHITYLPPLTPLHVMLPQQMHNMTAMDYSVSYATAPTTVTSAAAARYVPHPERMKAIRSDPEILPSLQRMEKKLDLDRNGVPQTQSESYATSASNGFKPSRKRGSIADFKQSPKSFGKRQRLQWTDDLHALFLKAIEEAGGIDNAVPKQLLHNMKSVQGLSRENVASHLQKYRSKMKTAQVKEQEGTALEHTRKGRKEGGGVLLDDIVNRPEVAGAEV